ncbi:MAG: YceI family protein [Bdellovibrionales bacterium]|jgi:polyisoprenoid-binding protein YceI|nr:YceI family protein [Bdellovibrionales bacterium]
MQRFSFLTLTLFNFILFGATASWAKPEVVLSLKMFPSAGNFNATSNEVKGFARMSGTKVIAEGISVPIKSLDAEREGRTKHMNEKYLEMGKYPEAKLIKAEGENGQGKGIIEIHGVQKPIQGTFKVEKDELVANFVVKISDFGIAKVNYLGMGVKDEVAVMVRVPIKK